MQKNSSIFLLLSFFILDFQALTASVNLIVPLLNLLNVKKNTPDNSTQIDTMNILPPRKKGDFKDRKRIVPQSFLDAKEVNNTSNNYPFLLAQPKQEFSDSDLSDSDELKPKRFILNSTNSSAFRKAIRNSPFQESCSSSRTSPNPRSTDY